MDPDLDEFAATWRASSRRALKRGGSFFAMVSIASAAIAFVAANPGRGGAIGVVASILGGLTAGVLFYVRRLRHLPSPEQLVRERAAMPMIAGIGSGMFTAFAGGLYSGPFSALAGFVSGFGLSVVGVLLFNTFYVSKNSKLLMRFRDAGYGSLLR